jgi:hypothetical protein
MEKRPIDKCFKRELAFQNTNIIVTSEIRLHNFFLFHSAPYMLSPSPLEKNYLCTSTVHVDDPIKI